MPSKSNKRYQHDCSDCTFLGVYEDYDLYTCPQKPLGKTYIARYGSQGPQYTSMALMAFEQLTLLEIKKTQVLIALFNAYCMDQIFQRASA